MIKEINKITKNSLDLNNLKENHLSIQLCLDGFSFCIQDIYSKEVKAFAQYDFVNDTSISPEKHLNYIEELFEKDSLLQQEYNSINVTHSNNLTTQVPKAFFDKNKLKEYLQYTVKVLKNDFITTDEIGNSEIMNVYIPFVNVNNFLIDRFGSFYFKHSSTVLIETLLNKYKNLEKDFLIVNVSFNNLEIVILKNQKLELYNSYSFNTKEDFIYYILFTAEQLEMNPEDFELVLLGDIEKESELYAILYQYIRKINFHENTEFPDLLNDISSHTNFTLLNQF